MDLGDIFNSGTASSVGSGAATGSAFGPWGAAAGAAIGLGSSIFGGMKSMEGAKEANQAQVNIINLEQQSEGQRKNAMELSAHRQSMEALRVNQRMRSMALNNATGQGAQFGSGLQGGEAQIQGQSEVNLLGINQNLEIGENLFNINAQKSQQQLLLAAANSKSATGNAISGMGKAVAGSIDSLSRLSSYAGGKASSLGSGNSGGSGTTNGWGNTGFGGLY